MLYSKYQFGCILVSLENEIIQTSWNFSESLRDVAVLIGNLTSSSVFWFLKLYYIERWGNIFEFACVLVSASIALFYIFQSMANVCDNGLTALDPAMKNVLHLSFFLSLYIKYYLISRVFFPPTSLQKKLIYQKMNEIVTLLHCYRYSQHGIVLIVC